MSNKNIQSKYYSMFKAYDLRGILDKSEADLFYWFGYGFVTQVLIPEKLPLTVNVMHDTRVLSPYFYNFVCQGIVDAGGSVNPLGYGSTDMLYAAAVYNQLPSIELTASHNPKEYHGTKVVKKAPQMMGLETGLGAIRDFILNKLEAGQKSTEIVDFQVDMDLKTAVTNFFIEKYIEIGNPQKVDQELEKLGLKLKISVDTGNGIAGFLMPEIAKLYKNIQFIPLYWEMDGNFPNHPANPQEFENLVDLKNSVLQNQAIFGAAFDGDADRLAIVDENGEPIQGDFLVSAFAGHLLENFDPKSGLNKAVVYVQPGSKCIPQTISNYDGVAVPSMQGHLFMKEAMSKYKAVYGGEFSGHHYFPQLAGMDSGFLPLALFIKMYVDKKITKVSQFFDSYSSRYFISDLYSPNLPANQTWQDVENKLRQTFSDGIISNMDGISVFYPDWKFSMRPSNTEPKVRFILETYETDRVAEKLDFINKLIGF